MPYNPHFHHRRSIRLKGYDYSWPGAYYVTIAVQGRRQVLSTIRDDHVELTEPGHYVRQRWDDLPNHYRHIKLDAFVIMPNHMHGIVMLSDANGEFDVVGMGWRMFLDGERTVNSDTVFPVGAGLRPAPTRPAPTTDSVMAKRHPLTEIVRAFKSYSARDINAYQRAARNRFWQRNYFEHIIRNDKELYAIQHYIRNNPAKWEQDTLFGMPEPYKG